MYTKKQGAPPDWTDPVILRQGGTVKDVCNYIHNSLAADLKSALVWGTSVKYSPQRVAVTHELDDEDVCMIVKKA